MSLQSRLAALITAIGTDIKALNTDLANRPKWYYGIDSFPASGDGAIGDWAVNGDSHEVFRKFSSTVWASVGFLGQSRLWTFLPSLPYDGQEIFYQSAAMATDGLVWKLRYNAGSSSAYKWEVISADAMFHEVTAEVTIASVGPSDLTGGPTLTTPLAGDYMVEAGCETYRNSTGTAQNSMWVKIGAAVPATANRFMWASTMADGASAIKGTTGSRKKRINAIASGTVIKHQYGSSAGTCAFVNRWLSITPIRVG